MKSDTVNKDELKKRSDTILDIIFLDISSEYVSRPEIVRKIRLLLRLGYEDEAKSMYLSSRADIISRSLSKLILNDQEDIPFYITQAATIHFTLIRATIDVYRECFTLYRMVSTLVEWVKNQVEKYTELFAEALKNVKVGTEVRM